MKVKKLEQDEHRRRFPRRWIRLDAAELERAQGLGMRRYQESVNRGRGDTLGEDSAQSHIIRARGEFVAARYFTFPEPNSVNASGKPDLGDWVSVRTHTTWDDELNIRVQDQKEHAWLLVTWFHTGGVIRGWRVATDLPGSWFKDHGPKGNPGWFVPIEELQDPLELYWLLLGNVEHARHLDPDRECPEAPAEKALRDIGRTAFGIVYEK